MRKDSTLTLRLGADLARAVARLARKRAVPRSQVVRDAVVSYLESERSEVGTAPGLALPGDLLRRLGQRAAERNEPVASLIVEFARRGLEGDDEAVELDPLPRHAMGPPLVDIADRDALYRAMEGA